MQDKRIQICKTALSQREVEPFWETIKRKRNELAGDVDNLEGKFDQESVMNRCAKMDTIIQIDTILSWIETD